MAFWALVEMLRARFGIAENDTSDIAADKLSRGLENWIDDEADRAYAHPRLARLLGVPTDQLALRSVAREELFAGWRVFLEHLARKGPLVLVFDDLHHVDAGLSSSSSTCWTGRCNVPIFVLALARPELEVSRPGWGSGATAPRWTLGWLGNCRGDECERRRSTRAAAWAKPSHARSRSAPPFGYCAPRLPHACNGVAGSLGRRLLPSCDKVSTA
ncbi:MAG: hypothetical protein WKF73_15685 [Nocardioidaceae bacterium]